MQADTCQMLTSLYSVEQVSIKRAHYIWSCQNSIRNVDIANVAAAEDKVPLYSGLELVPEVSSSSTSLGIASTPAADVQLSALKVTSCELT
mmetsp:Transcript_13913/g.23170  ORF Transcript_13913/g.23170 Transcript_13913/m.23170 type:complete len:91 (+) Transcript_13913:63-335(+)